MEFGEYNQKHLEDYAARCTAFADYRALFRAKAFKPVRRFVWRNPACPATKIGDLQALRPDLQFRRCRYRFLGSKWTVLMLVTDSMIRMVPIAEDKRMTLEGTVVNGVIVLDGGAQLPEGERVRVEVADPNDLSPPPEPYDRAKELAILREALGDVQAGRGTPAREFLKELAVQFNLSLAPGE
jgi:hypothetical protein